MSSQIMEEYAEIIISSEVLSAMNDVGEMNAALKNIVDNTRKETKAKYLFGGYLEKRDIYRSSEHFSENKIRNIHLGIDIWAEIDSPLYAAMAGVIHSMKFNDAKLDYGYCLIIRYDNGDFMLYGHLSEYSIKQFKVGDAVVKGQCIGTIGDKMVNGGWEPHLHIQLIKDIGFYQGDYPGVCQEEDLEYYKINCPDPLDYILERRKFNQ